MGALIDVVGHFGTTFSYATVGSMVARALREHGLLGSVWNVDAAWHPSFGDLRSITAEMMPATHVLVFAGPFHYMDAYPLQYGRARSAIFMSPNTDRLAPEHAETCGKYGLAVVPSAWCESAVRASVDPETQVAHLPLGTSVAFSGSRRDRVFQLGMRLSRRRKNPPCRVLHFSTDQSWPGRKGTEELLAAWALLSCSGRLRGAHLTVHVPPALNADAEYRCRDLEVDESVTVAITEEHGSDDDPLSLMLDGADLVVAPSRCEGFGMMLLASLVAGVPLLSTYNTGHADFLARSPGWMGIPTAQTGPLHGEDGLCPVVEPEVLAQGLAVAMRPGARRALLQSGLSFDAGDSWGTWPEATRLWVARLTEWVEETA